MRFSEQSLVNGGIVFDINFEKLYSNPNIACGDIAWISQYKHETEILIAPCMVWIYDLDKKYWPKQYLRRYNNNNANNNSVIYGAQLRQLRHVSLLMKRLKDKIIMDNDSINAM